MSIVESSGEVEDVVGEKATASVRSVTILMGAIAGILLWITLTVYGYVTLM